MRDSAETVTSFVMNHMKLVDQRATEVLRKGDRVHVKGRPITGVIMLVEPDGRLEKLNLGFYEGWWHVKDLEKVKTFSRNAAAPLAGNAQAQGGAIRPSRVIGSGTQKSRELPLRELPTGELQLLELCERMDAWIKM